MKEIESCDRVLKPQFHLGASVNHCNRLITYITEIRSILARGKFAQARNARNLNQKDLQSSNLFILFVPFLVLSLH